MSRLYRVSVRSIRNVERGWSVIASQLPGRTDNEIKNYWNSHLSRKIYRFLRAKNSAPLASVDITNILQMKRRTGRVRRSVAKKYNKNRVVTKIKSPPPSTSNESTLKRLNRETRDDQSIVSNEICMYNNDTAVDHVGGINLILEDIENQELGPNEIGYQGDELMDMDAFLESGSLDSNGLLSLHDEQQIEKIFADLSVECDRKNDKKDEILRLSASHSLGFCSFKDHKEIGFDDDMMLWPWEDDNLDLHRY